MEIIKNGLILFAITLIAGALLGLTYEVTKEPIADAQAVKQENALQKVFTGASFDEMNALTNADDYPYIDKAFEASVDGSTAGYAFKMITPEGYGGNIEFVVGLSLEGHVTGIDIIKHAETPGLGAKAAEADFKDQFLNKPTKSLEVVKTGASVETDIEAISAATITSKAVTNAVNQAIDCFNNELGGMN